ncbi:PAS domain-containing protein [Nitrospira sp. Nam80]
MTFGKNQSLLLQCGALAVLTAGIFLLDLLTPLGIVLWPLYFLPLVLTFRLPRKWSPYSFCLLVSALSLAAFLFSPPGLWPLYDAVNRMIGLSAMWGFTILTIRYRRSRTALILTEARRERALEDLSVEISKRRAAESGQAAVTAELQELSQEKTKALDARRRAEEAALAARIRLEGTVQSAMDAIITVDEEQRVVLFNQTAEQMFGCSVEEVIEQLLDRFIPERFRRAHRDRVNAFGQSGVTSRRMGALGIILGLRGNGEELSASDPKNGFRPSSKLCRPACSWWTKVEPSC